MQRLRPISALAFWTGAAVFAAFAVHSPRLFAADNHSNDTTNWADYGGGEDSGQYSRLKQIEKTNVKDLELAWFYPAPTHSGRFGYNPVVVDGVMYVMSKENSIAALNAATGKEI